MSKHKITIKRTVKAKSPEQKVKDLAKQIGWSKLKEIVDKEIKRHKIF